MLRGAWATLASADVPSFDTLTGESSPGCLVLVDGIPFLLSDAEIAKLDAKSKGRHQKARTDTVVAARLVISPTVVVGSVTGSQGSLKRRYTEAQMARMSPYC